MTPNRQAEIDVLINSGPNLDAQWRNLPLLRECLADIREQGWKLEVATTALSEIEDQCLIDPIAAIATKALKTMKASKPCTKAELTERINRVIDAPAFLDSLHANDYQLWEFQAGWTHYDSFETLPPKFKDAILAGEAELAGKTP